MYATRLGLSPSGSVWAYFPIPEPDTRITRSRSRITRTQKTRALVRESTPKSRILFRNFGIVLTLPEQPEYPELHTQYWPTSAPFVRTVSAEQPRWPKAQHTHVLLIHQEKQQVNPQPAVQHHTRRAIHSPATRGRRCLQPCRLQLLDSTRCRPPPQHEPAPCRPPLRQHAPPPRQHAPPPRQDAPLAASSIPRQEAAPRPRRLPPRQEVAPAGHLVNRKQCLAGCLPPLFSTSSFYLGQSGKSRTRSRNIGFPKCRDLIISGSFRE